jgi:prephenate dehydratase
VSVAYLGPEGTFTARAAALVAPTEAHVPLPTIPDVVDAVRTGAVDRGVVPIENSIEGAVNVTLDALAFGEPGVFIRGEQALPIAMALLARPGTALADVTEVRSHPMALPQCRRWLAVALPGAALAAAASTARAAEEVAAGPPGLAALGPADAADRLGLAVLADDVQDHDGNETRFVVLGRRMPAPTGADKTSMVVFLGADRPGLLMTVLDELALRGINLTKIESRPTKQALGEYCIFIDADGHVTDARVAEALRSIHRHVAELKVLGTYPRGDGHHVRVDVANGEHAYAGAARWFDGLLAHVDPA